MDPNENLSAQRRIVAFLRQVPKDDDGGYSDDEANERDSATERLVDLVEALDGWMSRGGFPPDAWRVRKPHSPERRKAIKRAKRSSDDAEPETTRRGVLDIAMEI